MLLDGLVSPVSIGLAVGIAFIVLFAAYPIPSNYSDPGNDVVITLKRTPCLGDCPVYSLEIYGDGLVIFYHLTDPRAISDSHVFGIDLTSTVRPHVYYVPKENVDELVEEFYHIDYLSLNSSYLIPVTDLPATITSFTVDGETKSIYNCLAGPRELYELERMIDRIAETDRWIDTSTIVDQIEVISFFNSISYEP